MNLILIILCGNKYQISAIETQKDIKAMVKLFLRGGEVLSKVL